MIQRLAPVVLATILPAQSAVVQVITQSVTGGATLTTQSAPLVLEVTSTAPAGGVATFDGTWTISAPAGMRGHVVATVECFGDSIMQPGMQVDVGDDGTNELHTLPPWPMFTRVRHTAASFAAGPVVVRIRSQNDVAYGPGNFYHLRLEFVAWDQFATDLGSSCGQSIVGAMLMTEADRDCFLAGMPPSSASSVMQLVASGFGQVQAFLLGFDNTRFPMHWSGLGPGCDDIMANPLFSALWIGGSPSPDTWILDVPNIPGLVFYAQSVNLGTAPTYPTFRVGVSNLLQVNT